MRKILLVVPLLAIATGGCASASASAKAKDVPALNVPPPPARVIEPSPEPLPEPVSELPTTPAATPPATRPNRPREQRPPATEAKPGEKPVEPPPPEPAPVTPPPVAPPAQLRTPETADGSNAAKTVRATIDRTNQLFSGINYQSLSKDRKKAYDDAKRFIQQAEDALKQGNIVFAQGVATKAETLAKELAGR
jgi:Predicted membrane protein